MARIYIKTWLELKADKDTTTDFYNENLLHHRYHTGSYSQTSHGKHGGEYVDAILYSDGQARAHDLWFPKWSYNVSSFYYNDTIHTDIDQFKDDYEAFKAWQNSIDRRKAEANERVKESFRKAFPKEYRNREDESENN